MLSILTLPSMIKTVIIILVLQMRTLRHRKLENLIQGHIARDRHSRIPMQAFPTRHQDDCPINYSLTCMIMLGFRKTSSLSTQGLAPLGFPASQRLICQWVMLWDGATVCLSTEWPVRVPRFYLLPDLLWLSEVWTPLPAAPYGWNGSLSALDNWNPRRSCVQIIL